MESKVLSGRMRECVCVCTCVHVELVSTETGEHSPRNYCAIKGSGGDRKERENAKDVD